ncbi:hypothetical protein HanOQP8_Chr05g0198181 [Helianthus annuus]|nr:hypothetical protein HanIR_Chr14g0688091 [Helianthus annuus]KAJ0738280.1 hypothetical protein HanLR1_Chr06g0216471 [Helianthus annuus]KAJ0748158.1 hypothetical protein HanOQP8_Chr05g0198181 [Helianthus annuus]KAJ0915424.1 hypothetical protein HanPSC8_Chr06g0249691 [Helianthus annuus]
MWCWGVNKGVDGFRLRFVLVQISRLVWAIFVKGFGANGLSGGRGGGSGGRAASGGGDGGRAGNGGGGSRPSRAQRNKSCCCCTARKLHMVSNIDMVCEACWAAIASCWVTSRSTMSTKVVTPSSKLVRGGMMIENESTK